MKKVLLVLCLVPFIAAAPPVTKVSLSQIQVTAAASQPGAILMVMTTGILQQVQLGTGFVLTTGSDGQPVLSAPGGGGQQPNFIVAEAPSIQNLTGTLTHAPIQSSEAVYINGLRQNRALGDYSISGATITLVSWNPGDTILVDYRW